MTKISEIVRRWSGPQPDGRSDERQARHEEICVERFQASRDVTSGKLLAQALDPYRHPAPLNGESLTGQWAMFVHGTYPGENVSVGLVTGGYRGYCQTDTRGFDSESGWRAFTMTPAASNV